MRSCVRQVDVLLHRIHLVLHALHGCQMGCPQASCLHLVVIVNGQSQEKAHSGPNLMRQHKVFARLWPN